MHTSWKRDRHRRVGDGDHSSIRCGATGYIHRSDNTNRGVYIALLNDEVEDIPITAAKLVGANTLGYTYTTLLRGFSFRGSEQAAMAVSRNPIVNAVYQDSHFEVASIQYNPSNWGLNRIDQRDLPLSSSYAYQDVDGANVTIFVVDTGVNDHSGFGGRLVGNINFVSASGENRTDDCYPHGTAVASQAAGATHGVARASNIYDVRVYGCT